ncbi:MAG: nitrous oxide reductase accessory protein NosL, partial [Pyrobaculum sp.]
MLATGISVAAIGAIAYSTLHSTGEEVPDIRLGVDKCAYCQMVIVDKRFAALYKYGSRWLKFDDLICLIDFLKSVNRLNDFSSAYVFDYVSGNRLRASNAYFVVQKKIPTPMGSGILAFANYDEALKYGKVYTAT